MFEFILIGSGFAFAAAIQPGPLQAFLLSSVAQKGYKRTLPASLAPLLSGGPIALLVLLVLNRVPDVMSQVLCVAATHALWKPAPQQNSIWQIVDHLIASKQWLIEMLERGQAAPPVWTDPSGDEAAWQAALDRLKDAHHRLKAAVEQAPEDKLLTIPELGGKLTLLELILSSGPAHEAHHSGQIDYLKGLLAG